MSSSGKTPTGEITDALGRIVRRATLPRFTDRVAERAGTALDRSAYALLVRIADRPSRIGALATIVGLDVSTVSRQVDALEQAGLAHRQRHPTDRRGWLVVIDPPGRRALDAHRQARGEIFHELLGDLDASDLTTTAGVLSRLAARIEDVFADESGDELSARLATHDAGDEPEQAMSSTTF